MMALYPRHAAVGDAWMIGRWHESRGGEASPSFDVASPAFADHGAAVQWLRDLPGDDLRRAALEYLDVPGLSRLTDANIVDLLAAMILGRELLVWLRNPRRSRFASDSELTTEEKLVRRLRVTAHAFVFEGSRFRIVDARNWAQLRGSDDERYQVLPQASAQALLEKMAQWAALSADETAAIAQALPLVPEVWRPAQARGGILLLRILERYGQVTGAEETSAVTPSQLAGRQKDVETHWIQIELIDLEDQPVPNEAYKIELPGGEIREGRLDAKGTAYIGGLTVGGQCKVCFPDIDTKEWRAA